MKILLMPLSILVGIIILSFIAGQVIFSNITRLNNEVATNTQKEVALQQKLTSLQQVSEVVANNSEVATRALPGTSSILTAVGELQLQSISLGLSLGRDQKFRWA